MLEDFRLRVFVTVAECGSFTAAAKALGISQPAVSQNISQLEQLAGGPLFDRSKGCITLTDKGLLFDGYARRILHWYERMDAVVIKGTEQAPEPAVLDLGDGKEAEVLVEEGSLKIRIK